MPRFGVPAKSKILWATQQPSALLGRAASAAPDGGSPCVGRPESSIQRGPRKIKDFVGCSAALGPSGPRRECGARRRKPVCRATGVFNPEGSPQNQRFCGLLSSPRPFWAAPRVRRPTEEARVSGDRSLFNPEGSPQNQRFCGLHSSPRPFWAAPRVRRPTEEARVSGDQSLFNPEGSPQNQRFCGEKNRSLPRRGGSPPAHSASGAGGPR